MPLKYSVVIPLKDEEENIEILVNEIAPVMKELNCPWELLCVDDGSTDGTIKKLKDLQIQHRELKILAFDKNYGQSSAFDAGFRNAKGEFIITMDGDLQNDPKDIPALVEKVESYDLICGY
ncbi:MAG: glycosyltransferase, partial [Chlamydiota bacterium]